MLGSPRSKYNFDGVLSSDDEVFCDLEEDDLTAGASAENFIRPNVITVNVDEKTPFKFDG